jgi:hypothetical protein
VKRTIRLGSTMAFSLLALPLLFHWKSADAQVIDDTWIGSAGQWNVAGNWSSGEPLNGTPPGATYNVSISNGGAVTMNNGLNSSTPIDNLTVGSSSSLSIVEGNNLTITGNSLDNAGVITLNSAGYATYIGIDASKVTLSGGGTVTMSNNANNYIVGSATANTLTNEETIQGAGSIGGGNGSTSLTLVNSGVIDANQSAGMTIQANGGTTNTGILESTSGSTLTLSGTFTNAGGSILADASGLKLSSAIINGGSVTLSGDSTLQFFDGTIHGGSTLTNSATGLIEALSGSNNTLGGTVNNSAGGVIQIDDDATVNLEKGNYSSLGAVTLNSAGHETVLGIIGANVVLSGGTVTMSNNANNYIAGSATANTLTNEETIQGSGSIGGGNGSISLTLVNSGIIDANQSVALTIQANGGTTNTGTLESTSGSTLNLSGTFTNAGGSILADASELKLSSAIINGGTVTLTGDSTLQLANGTIHGGSTVTNSATGMIEAVAGTNNTLGGTVNNLAGGVIQIDNDAILNLQSGSYAKLGTVAMNSAGNETSLVIDGANVTLSGGTVTLSNNAENYIYGAAKADMLTNEESISGAGHIGAGQMTLTNSGTINSDDSAGMTIQANGGTKNTGTLEATAGSTLALTGMTVTNTGGTISADTGQLQVASATINGGAVTLTGASTLQLSNGTIHGGSTLTNSATGLIEAMPGTNNTLGSTVNNSAGGVIQIDNDSILNLQSGSYAKLGTVAMNSTANSTTLIVDGAKVTLSGGTLTLSDSAENFIYGAATADTLNNQERISGAGHIGNGQMTLTNSGTIDSDGSAGMTIQANGGTKNTGTLEATAGSTLALAGMTVTNTGGTIAADASELQVTSATINGGAVTLTGASTLQLSNGVIHGGSTLTNSATGLIEATAGTSTLGGKVINPAGGLIQINNAAALNLESGTYARLGSVTVNSTGNQTSLIVDGANVAMSGGSVTLTNNINNYILGAAGADTLTNEETISGAGHIGGGQMTLVNSGTINANQTAGMIIQTSGSFTNNGTLAVASGDLMHILGGAFTNFSGGALTGGTYNTSGTLEIDQLGSAGGEIATNAANITLQGAAANIVDAAGKGALTSIATNATAGSLSLAGGGTLTTAGNFTNAGKLTIGTGSSFTVGGPALFSQKSGITTANGTLSASGGVNVEAGSLYGSGSISGNISSSGLVEPGQTTGTTGILTDSGAYTQNAAGSLDIAIAGATVGTKFDELTATTASLGGTLNISLVNGFVPAIGTKFKIVNFTSESGQFATVNGLAINSSEHFTVTYQGADVLLTVVSGAAPSSLARLNSIATLDSRPSGEMRLGSGNFAFAESLALADSMNADSRARGEQPADRGMRIQSASPASQTRYTDLAVTANQVTDGAPPTMSGRSGFRVAAAFATVAEHHAPAAFAGIASMKPYGVSSPRLNLGARTAFGSKVARSNLQFSLPNLHSRPRVSLSLD